MWVNEASLQVSPSATSLLVVPSGGKPTEVGKRSQLLDYGTRSSFLLIADFLNAIHSASSILRAAVPTS